MVNDGEIVIACGVVQVTDLGLGHMLIGDPMAEIDGMKLDESSNSNSE